MNNKRLENIKAKLSLCDRIIYIIKTGMIEEDATSDMEYLIKEIENFKNEIKALNNIIKILSGKMGEKDGVNK